MLRVLDLHYKDQTDAPAGGSDRRDVRWQEEVTGQQNPTLNQP